MKILVITQMYSQPDDVGDNKPTKTINYFVKEWIGQGHQVVVIHCSSKFPLPLYLLPDWIKNLYAGRISSMVPPLSSRKTLTWDDGGAKIYRLPMKKWMPGMGYSRNAMAVQVKKISALLDEEGFTPELVLGHFANPSLELVARLAKQYGAKSSIVFHQDCTLKNIQKYRMHQWIAQIGAVGARSVKEAEVVQKNLRLKSSPFVCCSGVPDASVEAAERSCDKHDFTEGVRYLYVGSLIQRKHVDSVIRAFADVANSKDILTIVGGGMEEAALKELVQQLQVEDKVSFTGRVSREEVQQHMKRAHVFTLISDMEAYGMVYMEAMLQGCLVIASQNGGFDGLIQNGDNGYLCEPGNHQMLSKLYREIASLSKEQRNAIGQKAIDLALHYSERDVAARYLEDVLKHQGL